MSSLLLAVIAVILLYAGGVAMIVGAGLFLWREFKVEHDRIRADFAASLETHRGWTEKQLAKFVKVIENTRSSGESNDWNSRTELRAIHAALAQGDISAGQHLAEVGGLPPIERLRAIDERLSVLDESITGNE